MLLAELIPTPTFWPTQTPTPTVQIWLTELLPKPSQGDEWVELYNSGVGPVILTGWQLWDELTTPNQIFSFTTQEILAKSWLIVPINRKLNDGEDGITLKNATGDIVDQTHYLNAPTDQSWSRWATEVNSSWSFMAQTPNATNPTPTPTPTPSPSSTPTAGPSSTPTSIPSPTHSQTPTSTLTLIPVVISTTPTLIKTPSPSFAITASPIMAKPTPKPTQTKSGLVLKSPPNQPTPAQIITQKITQAASIAPSPPVIHLNQTQSAPTRSFLTLTWWWLGLALWHLATISFGVGFQGMISQHEISPIISSNSTSAKSELARAPPAS